MARKRRSWNGTKKLLIAVPLCTAVAWLAATQAPAAVQRSMNWPHTLQMPAGTSLQGIAFLDARAADAAQIWEMNL